MTRLVMTVVVCSAVGSLLVVVVVIVIFQIRSELNSPSLYSVDVE